MKAPKIEILGGGPAGLYAAILIRRMLPDALVRVSEQNPESATFGFGVVFSDKALDFLAAVDPQIHDLMVPQMERWENMTLNLLGERVTLDGVGFASIGRLELIELLKEHAQSLDVPIRFNTQITSVEELEADLVIGADGLNSLVRGAQEEVFAPQIENFGNHFAWFGAQVPFDTLTQTFIHTEHGPMNAHHYRYAPGKSTFIVECDAATYQAHGFADMSEAQSAQRCSALFADTLQGTALVTNKSMWRQFPKLWCETWVSGRYALVGDAVHTAHFSIGSGTRLALEDAMALVQALADHEDIDTALQAYQDSRAPIAKKIVTAANTSAEWYDSFGEKMGLPAMQFAYDYLMRSGRIGRERMRQIAPQFSAAYEAYEAAQSAAV